jgi:prepilin-type N-terminal cleavage/methylation domain-containing protein
MTRRIPPAVTSSAGFTFIEVLMAMSVLVVGSISVLGLFTIGVDRMVQRRVEARFQQVRPEIESILQSRVDATKPGDPVKPIPVAEAVPLSRAGYALACQFLPSPFDGAPGILASVSLLYHGAPVKRELVVLRRSFVTLKEISAEDGAK